MRWMEVYGQLLKFRNRRRKSSVLVVDPSRFNCWKCKGCSIDILCHFLWPSLVWRTTYGGDEWSLPFVKQSRMVAAEYADVGGQKVEAQVHKGESLSNKKIKTGHKWLLGRTGDSCWTGVALRFLKALFTLRANSMAVSSYNPACPFSLDSYWVFVLLVT